MPIVVLGNHVDQQSHILIKITILSKSEINCGSPGILPNGWLEGSRTTLHAVVTFRSSNIFIVIIIILSSSKPCLQCNAKSCIIPKRCQEGMTFSGPSYRTICQVGGRIIIIIIIIIFIIIINHYHYHHDKED